MYFLERQISGLKQPFTEIIDQSYKTHANLGNAQFEKKKT